MKTMNKAAGLALAVVLTLITHPLAALAQAGGCTVDFLSRQHCLLRLTQQKRYVLLPVEERAPLCNMKLLRDGRTVKTFNVRLAVDNTDYYVPLDLHDADGGGQIVDIHINGDPRKDGDTKGYACWNAISMSDTFSTANRERLRPEYHHTPLWGWMNDPNGMFYKDGTYHLYYQHNPFGSQWENMTWGHSTSADLLTWKDEGDAILPDGLGTIFSGCAVVDNDNTAGFGRGTVVVFYTSAGESQTQSMAYSTDNGRTFVKYEGNPVLTAEVPDFRDPHVFFHKPTGRWVMILAAGQEMRIYSSADLKAWKYESNFGGGYGNHGGVWECPDLFELPVQGESYGKWVLVCNINPGGPAGGSATQYFTGEFDGHKFTCDTKPEVTKWADYGKDHYAAVSFDNAPDGRRIMLGWMSNWQYAAQVPTLQYRSANTIARDMFLFKDGDTEYLGSAPSPEYLSLRGKAAVSLKKVGGSKQIKSIFGRARKAYEIVLGMKGGSRGSLSLTLSNGKGEKVTVTVDAQKGTLSMDRRQSGETQFSEHFPVITTAPLTGCAPHELRLFIDSSSIEAFVDGGRAVMSNTVFPSEPYNALTVHCAKGQSVTNLNIYPLNK